MTQAHKTPGAVVVLKDDEKDDLPPYPENIINGKWEVMGMLHPGHTHVRSLVDPTYELRGWHSERFKTIPKGK